MNITEVNQDPAIVDVHLPELNLIDIDSILAQPRREGIYSYDPTNCRDELTMLYETNVALRNLLEDRIRDITRQLISMDKHRYPMNGPFNEEAFRKFYNTTTMTLNPVVDNPGFKQNWHLDTRFALLSGMINLQDNTTQTHFARENLHQVNGTTPDDINDKVIHKGQTEKFKGTFWLNTELTWHCVPLVKDIRKILLFNVFLYQA